MAKTSQAQIKASIAHNQKKDSITIRPDKETGLKIRTAAQEVGESVTTYILEAVRRRMEQEQSTQAQAAEDTMPRNTAAEETEDFDEMPQSTPAVVPEEEVTFENLFNDNIGG